MTLAGRTAVVTGGSKGIGRAACLAFAREGADVVVHCRSDRAAAEEIVDEVRAFGRGALVVAAEVSDEDEVARMLDEVAAFSSTVHVLFNNAGIYPFGSLEDMSLEDWEHVMAVNVRGPFLVTRAALPLLKAGGAGGRVINIGSVMSLKDNSCALHYVTSKAAVVGFTRGLARELAPHGVTANCVVPSVVRTGTAERDYGERVRADRRRAGGAAAPGAGGPRRAPRLSGLEGERIRHRADARRRRRARHSLNMEVHS